MFQFDRPPILEKDLFCSFLHHNDPFIVLGPFQYEVKLSNPEMILIHNFAQKNETEGFIEKAKGKLTATPLYVPNKPQGPIIF